MRCGHNLFVRRALKGLDKQLCLRSPWQLTEIAMQLTERTPACASCLKRGAPYCCWRRAAFQRLAWMRPPAAAGPRRRGWRCPASAAPARACCSSRPWGHRLLRAHHACCRSHKQHCQVLPNNLRLPPTGTLRLDTCRHCAFSCRRISLSEAAPHSSIR